MQAGKAAGVPLERIRAALDPCPNRRTPTKRDWERLSRSWARELDERIATLEAIRGRLTTCIGCGCLSLRTCGLLNPGDVGIGPRRGSALLPPAARRGSAERAERLEVGLERLLAPLADDDLLLEAHDLRLLLRPELGRELLVARPRPPPTRPVAEVEPALLLDDLALGVLRCPADQLDVLGRHLREHFLVDSRPLQLE